MKNSKCPPTTKNPSFVVCMTKDEVTYSYFYSKGIGETLDYARSTADKGYKKVWIEFRSAPQNTHVLVLPFCHKCGYVHHKESYVRQDKHL